VNMVTHPQINQLVQNLAKYDAIGNYSRTLREILRGAGYRSEIYVGETTPGMRSECSDFRQHAQLASPENVLIFHHSMASPMSDYFSAVVDRTILIYHNITPAKYFFGINRDIYYKALDGRKELLAMARKVELGIGDSDYNRQELETVGCPSCKTQPIILDFDGLDREPSQQMMQSLDDGKTNIVFVGRISPNKKQEDVIRAFCCYKKYFNKTSRLILVGGTSQLPEYFKLLKTLVQRLKLDDVLFLNQITQSELCAVYRKADLFFSASEHEGFCIPLIEAMRFKVPVLAFAAAAVPETMGNAGLLYHNKHPIKTAALIDEIITDNDLRKGMIESGTNRLEAFDPQKLERDFLDIIEKFINGELKK
jgi:L-malate glycosyltransferase